MQRPRLPSRRWILALSIVMILLALVIWTIRPGPFNEWLGSAWPTNFRTPLSILREWASGGLAPMTPSGFTTLFPIADLLSLLALLVALGILLFLLAAQWRDRWTGSLLTRSIPLFRLPRVGVRVRTAMVLIAILGLGLGLEIVAWRNWKLRVGYLGQAHKFDESEASWRNTRHNYEVRLAKSDADATMGPERDSWTPAARAAARAHDHDLWRYQLDHASGQLAFYAELRQRYERAAIELPPQMPPDPAPPDWQAPPGLFIQGPYARALADCDEVIRRYPDHPWPRRQRAWILATCPDAKLRDGKRAVTEATRAAELTNWNDADVLRALAAAYAETGDFASAVRWQQRSREVVQEFYKRFPPPNNGGMAAPSGADPALELYKAGKPYRMGR